MELTAQEIQGLAGHLDGWDGLSDRERGVLGGVFAVAGAALAGAEAGPDTEVSGFAIDGYQPPPPGSFDAFEWGASQAQGQGKGGGTFFLMFDFKLVAVIAPFRAGQERRWTASSSSPQVRLHLRRHPCQRRPWLAVDRANVT